MLKVGDKVVVLNIDKGQSRQGKLIGKTCTIDIVDGLLVIEEDEYGYGWSPDQLKLAPARESGRYLINKGGKDEQS